MEAVALTNEFVAVAGGGYQTGLIGGLPAAAQWRLWGQVRMTWPDGNLARAPPHRVPDGVHGVAG